MSSRNNFALWSSIMRTAAVLIASAAINAFTIPAVAAECTSIKDIDASRSRWESFHLKRPYKFLFRTI